ncbi:FeoA family protein [Salipaludibacillus daqingensis]|uniref:FeoA family protein n=1 Tax=Salipaludibacillus daqingensis TaxID=3041001 RepID=UPI0024754A06|nr:FeoA family protein [Salipaludibacillus daqingensis]
MKLTELAVGDKATIVDMSGCSRMIQKRLTQLGIDDCAEVCVQNKLPFGGPCFIQCENQCISIRKKDAMSIEVCQESVI